METVTVTLPNETYRLLEERAQMAGKKAPQVLIELLEEALKKRSKDSSKTTRHISEILAASDRLRTLSPYLQNKIIPGILKMELIPGRLYGQAQE